MPERLWLYLLALARLQRQMQYSVLHRFTDATNDGAEPFSGLVFDKAGKHLYGTTAFGGTYNQGVVYEITP